MTTSYTTTVLFFGNNAAIEVPAANLVELGAGKRAPVIVELGGYSFQSTLGNMDGKTLIPFSKAHREAAGLKLEGPLLVKLTLDAGVRKVEMPPELASALKKENLLASFARMIYSKRKEFCRQVAEAKSPETKQRRVEKIILEVKTV
jgi:hypothetical protein